MHVTQAASACNQAVENELGAKLFIRAPRRVMLTEAGEQLLQRARQILREHDAAVDEIAELAGAERGRLRVGSASAMVATDVLPKLLKEVRKQHPRSEITVSSEPAKRWSSKSSAASLILLCVVAGRGTRYQHRAPNVRITGCHRVAEASVCQQRTISGIRLPEKTFILGERGGYSRLIDPVSRMQGHATSQWNLVASCDPPHG